jgi:AraC family transcriptional regulator
MVGAMNDVTERSVRKVIESMHENLSEVLTLDDMARTAMFSKFHFSRMFQRVTGLSPARFLSAVRLERAKHLLVTTSLSVTQISHQVGYASVGTFSTRFSTSVGMSPSLYRQRRGQAGQLPARPRTERDRDHAPAVCGRVELPAGAAADGAVFVGLFPERLPQGQPVRCAALPGAGRFTLAAVPAGTWYLLGYRAPAPDARRPLVGSRGPVTVPAGGPDHHVDLTLRPMSDLDPPMLLALPDGSAPIACARRTEPTP